MPSCTAAPKQLNVSLSLFMPWHLLRSLLFIHSSAFFFQWQLWCMQFVFGRTEQTAAVSLGSLFPLRRKNNRGRPGCFQHTTRQMWHVRETRITGAAPKQAGPWKEWFVLNESMNVSIIKVMFFLQRRKQANLKSESIVINVL